MLSSIDKQVQNKILAHLFESIRAGAGTTLLIGALLLLAFASGLVASPPIDSALLYGWYGLTVSVVAFRMWLRRKYNRESKNGESTPSLLGPFRLGAAFAGTCWGLIAAVSAFGPIDTYMTTLLVVGAMGVGAIPYLSADFRSYVLFMIGSVLPILAAEILVQSDRTLFHLALFTVYSLSVSKAGRRYAEHTTTSLTLRISANQLTRKLSDANQQLQKELEHGKQVRLQLQQARSTAESANRAKTIFLSRMSHELRTPLNAVLGFSELLSIMPLHELAEKKSDYLAKINASGAHLLSLIEDVLDITRIDTGQLSLEERRFQVSDVVDECITMLETQANEHSITLQLSGDSDKRIAISTDRRRFRQILLNLISNAIKYNEPGGFVGITTQALGDRIQIEVKDSGIGIARQDLDKAFEPFARLSNETGAIEGTGIGLTITKQLTEMLNGTISIESAIGDGTKVTVKLPRSLEQTIGLRRTGT